MSPSTRWPLPPFCSGWPALVLFNNIIFMVLPVLGIAAGIVALVQISRSNGTQTGREISIIGLLLCLGFGGFYATKTGYAAYRNNSDQTQIVATVQKLGELLKVGDYDNAYKLFDSRFQNQFNRQIFEMTWKHFTSSPYFGTLQYADWNHVLIFDVDPVDDTPMASGMMLFKARPDEPYRINMGFRKENGTWLINLLPQLFSIDPQAQQAPGGKSLNTSPMFGPPKPK